LVKHEDAERRALSHKPGVALVFRREQSRKGFILLPSRRFASGRGLLARWYVRASALFRLLYVGDLLPNITNVRCRK